MKFLSSLVLALSLSSTLWPFKFLFKPRDYVATHTIASIVRIDGHLDSGEPAVCTGFVVEKGRILTAFHCWMDRMSQDGVQVKVVGMDPPDDLLLLESPLLAKKPLSIRDKPVEKYEELTGVGYGWGWDRPLVLAQIVVYPCLAPTTSSVPGIVVQGGYIPGMSGGPVVDKDGRVVGIIQQSHDTIGYGVGVDRIREFLAGVK